MIRQYQPPPSVIIRTVFVKYYQQQTSGKILRRWVTRAANIAKEFRWVVVWSFLVCDVLGVGILNNLAANAANIAISSYLQCFPSPPPLIAIRCSHVACINKPSFQISPNTAICCYIATQSTPRHTINVGIVPLLSRSVLFTSPATWH